MGKVMEYWQAAVNVAGGSKVKAVFVLVRIVLCRLINGFGPKDYLLFSFHRKPFSSHKNYLKKDPLEIMQRRLNPEQARELAANKLKFYQRCMDNELPTPDILGVAGMGLSAEDLGNFDIFTCERDIFLAVQRQGEGVYLLKPMDGSHGFGIIRFRLENGLLITDNGDSLSESLDFKMIFNGDDRFLLQKSLKPHRELQAIMPGIGLGTVRLVTINNGKDIEIVLGCSKIPVGDSIADNFLAGSAGNLLAEIDIETGSLVRAFGPDFKHPGVVKEVSKHPETGVVLPGFCFPNWHSIIEAVEAGSRAFNELTTIGWDVALTEDGPSLIEANSCYDCDLLQVAMDRGLKDKFYELLG